MEHDHKHQYEIHVDGQLFTITQPTMSGAQIKALVGKDQSYQLFEEIEGHEDKLIGDNAAVTITNGLHFFTLPPAMMGNDALSCQ